MSVIRLAVAGAVLLGLSLQPGMAQSHAPYRVLQSIVVGGEGRFDYVFADDVARRLYVPHIGPTAAVAVFDLDTLAPAGSIPQASGHGVVVDQQSHHGFLSSKPVTMWDSVSLQTLKTIDVQGSPDAIAADAFTQRVFILSHSAPNVTVIDAKDGTVAGTIDLGGMPEQMVSDGAGRLYVDLEDKASIAVVDAKTLTVTARYDLAPAGGTCAGLAIDRKNGILFATCRNPQAMVIVRASDGKILTSLPIGMGSDGAAFNPNTMEAFSAQIDGTLSIIKEETPVSFAVEQMLQTKAGAKTLALDTKTNRIFLITADFSPAPPAVPGGPPSRPQMIPGSLSVLVVGR